MPLLLTLKNSETPYLEPLCRAQVSFLPTRSGEDPGEIYAVAGTPPQPQPPNSHLDVKIIGELYAAAWRLSRGSLRSSWQGRSFFLPFLSTAALATSVPRRIESRGR